MKVTPNLSLHNTDIGVSAFSSTTDVEAAYRKIEEEIEVLEAKIRAWKRRHNMRSITARLPPEILATVFKWLASIKSFSVNPFIQGLGWINVTHVCTHWRHVALGCPSLWTTIPFSHPQWAEEMLVRSKMAPLTVVTSSVTGSGTYSPRCLAMIRAALTKMSQIRKLAIMEGARRCVQNPPSLCLGELLPNLVNPAPILESLSVYLLCEPVPVLPQHLFSGEAPRLRKLKLHNCALAWDAPILHQLTSLQLNYIPRVVRPSMGQIIVALSGMPNLQTLELCDVLPEENSLGAASKSGPESMILLPHLTHLKIESDFAGEFLLNHLSYPPTASIVLDCSTSWESATLTGGPSYLPSVRGFCKVLGTSQSVRCLTARYGIHYNSIQLVTHNLPGTCLQQSGDAEVDFTLMLESSEMDVDKAWIGILRSLWTSIPLTNLESLHLERPRLHDCSYIFPSLAATKLKRLRVISNSGIGFLQTFSPDAAQNKQQISLKIPSLRELAIQGWLFGELGDNGTCIELLKACLEDRRKGGAAISELFLNRCYNVEDRDLEALGKIVKKVTLVWS